jgi:hypothetical protein
MQGLRRLARWLLLTSFAGCGGSTTTPPEGDGGGHDGTVAAEAGSDAIAEAAGSDAGHDTGADATLADAGTEAGADGGGEAAADSGPTAVCSTGLLAWAQGGLGPGVAVAPRHDGSVFATGVFSGTKTFGSSDGGAGDAGTATLTSAGGNDVYLALFGADGGLAWAQGAGGPSVDQPQGVAVSPSEGALATGWFSASATFGAGQPSTTTLPSAGSYDVFVTSYDATGTLQWARRAGGTGNDFGYGIGAASDGTAIVGGEFGADAIFGPGEPGQTTFSILSGVQAAAFVARYATDGHLLWAKAAQGATSTSIYGVAVAPDGSSYVVGTWWGGTSIFGRGEANQTSLATNATDAFLAHYAADGALAWIERTRASSTGGAIGLAISLAPEGALLVTGYLLGSVDFAPGEAQQTTVVATNTSNSDMFVASYGLDGTLRWVRHAGASPPNSLQAAGRGVAATPGGGAAVTGEITGQVTFGAGEPNQVTLDVGQFNGFVARYEPDGTLAWAKPFLDPDGGAEAQGMASAGDCSIFVTGGFASTVTFGSGDAGTATLSTSSTGGYLIRLNP